MRLSPRNFFASRLARRAFALYFGSLAAGLGLTIGLVYVVAVTALKRNERQLIELKADQISALYAKSGVDGLRRPQGWAFVRLKKADGTVLLENTPVGESGFDLKALDTAIPRTNPPHGTWLKVPKKDDEDNLNVLERTLADGVSLEVGKSDSDLNDQIELLLGALIGISGPLFLASVGIAFLATRRALGPVFGLVRTLKSVKAGAISARVPESGGTGEIQDLIRLFNSMLDQIENLVRQTRDEVDAFAHDIRTPISRFRLMAEKAIVHDLDRDALRSALSDAVQAADQITALISVVFDISLSESGSMRIERTRFSPAAMLEQICELYDFTAEERGIRILRSFGSPFEWNGDAAQIGRAAANLVDNAIKYSDRPGYVEVSLEQGGGEMRISVRDEGPGIPDAEKPKVWGKLFRGSNSEGREGFGLGLSLVKAIAEAHGGRASVESAKPRGTRFSIHIPIA